MSECKAYWHVTPSSQVRRCFVFDLSKKEGASQAAGCEGDSKMGCPIHPHGCPWAGYACGIDSLESAREVARFFKVGSSRRAPPRRRSRDA